MWKVVLRSYRLDDLVCAGDDVCLGLAGLVLDLTNIDRIMTRIDIFFKRVSGTAEDETHHEVG